MKIGKKYILKVINIKININSKNYIIIYKIYHKKQKKILPSKIVEKH